MFKIGIYGSAVKPDPAINQKLKTLGKILAREKVQVITGAAPGVPFLIANEAHQNGAEVIGFPPSFDISGLNSPNDPEYDPDHDLSIYSNHIFIPKEAKSYITNSWEAKMYRDFRSTQYVDAGIIIAGRWGTLNEFTNLIEMQKVIGVFVGTGGTADLLPFLRKKITKYADAQMIFRDDPEDIVLGVVNLLKS